MQALVFLVDALVGFFCTLFLLRFLMQALRVSFAGQLGHFVVALTNWGAKPLRRIIPGVGGYDWACLFAALMLQVLLAGVLVALSPLLAVTDSGTVAAAIAGMAVRNLLRLTIYVFMGALILQAVLSWINPYSPLAAPAYQLTRPLLDPIRRVIPPLSGIDLSVLVAILLLQALLFLV